MIAFERWHLALALVVLFFASIIWSAWWFILRTPKQVPAAEPVDDVPDQNWGPYGKDPKVEEYLRKQQ